MSLVENASKLSVEMVREVDTLTGIKRRLKEQLCRLQVEEKALRELQACEFTTKTTTPRTTTTTRTTTIPRTRSTTRRENKIIREDKEKSRGVKRTKVSTTIVLDEDSSQQRKSISSNEDDVNNQTLYLDLRSADKTDSSSSSKEENETATEDEKELTNVDTEGDI